MAGRMKAQTGEQHRPAGKCSRKKAAMAARSKPAKESPGQWGGRFDSETEETLTGV